MSFFWNRDAFEAFLERLLERFHQPEPEPVPTIAEIASSNDSFEILVAALGATGLTETFAEPGDFTVFAPTDDAFRELASKTLGLDIKGLSDAEVAGALVDALGTELLTTVLLYHVQSGASSQAEIEAAGSVTTLEGSSFGVEGGELVDADPEVENPEFIDGLTDIEASNGVIQAIDRVLLPIDVAEAMAQPTIADIAGSNESFEILTAALVVTGLDGVVADRDADFTVFAPTDDAFRELASKTLGLDIEGLSDGDVANAIVGALGVDLVADVLLYHVKAGAATKAEIEAAGSVDTAQGSSFGVVDGELVDADPDVENPEFIEGLTDIEAANGLIQAIDRVLLPIDVDEAMGQPTIADIATGNDNFEALVAALVATGLVDVVADPDADFTVFAPTDDAFRQLATDLGLDVEGVADADLAGALVDAVGAELVTDILLYHVAPGGKTVAELQSEKLIGTAEGGSIAIDGTSLVDKDPDATNPAFVDGLTDLEASNGQVQVIDRVLLPLDIAPVNDLKLVGTRKADVLQGGAGDDHIHGRAGDDLVLGGDGNDIIRGNRGDDWLFGDEGDDRVFGGIGNDVLVDGAGDDIYRGGWGRDQFDFTELAGHNTVRDFRWGDTLVLSADDFADVHEALSGFERVRGGLELETEDGSIFLAHVRHIDEHDITLV